MKKLLISFVVGIFSISCVIAQNSTVAKNGLLWKISGNGLEQPSFLLGTFHGSSGVTADFLPKIVGFDSVFSMVKQYIGESDPQNPARRAETLKTLGSQFLPKDSSYKVLLNQEEYHILDSVCKSVFKVSLDKVNTAPNYLRIALAMILLESELNKARTPKAGKVMDAYLIEMAREKGYAFLELDDLNTSSHTFRDISNQASPYYKENAKQMVAEISENYTNDSVGKQMIDAVLKLEEAYINQDIDALHKYAKIKNDLGFATMKKKTPEQEVNDYEDFLIRGRNEAWMKKLPAMIQNQSSLIGVGALHLPGEIGLINMLRKAGYTVESVN